MVTIRFLLCSGVVDLTRIMRAEHVTCSHSDFVLHVLKEEQKALDDSLCAVSKRYNHSPGFLR